MESEHIEDACGMGGWFFLHGNGKSLECTTQSLHCSSEPDYHDLELGLGLAVGHHTARLVLR